MINYKYADLFNGDSVDKQLIITTDDGSVTITNKEIHSEQFELNESICSDSTLRYGSCEASSLKMRIANVFTSLKGKWLTVKCVLNGHDDEPFVFGRYKVDSDKPTADKRYRDIVAYDVMYDILTADVAEWYNSLTFPMTLRAFRNALISHFNLEEVEISLPNDEMTVERTIEPSEISGRDVLTAICELNACFGHIGRNGKFQYVVLKEITQGLYPSNTLFPANDLFPRDTNATRIKSGKYIKATYEDYVVQKINSVQIRQEENDIGGASGSGENAYIIEDNFLVYGKTTDELNGIAAKFLSAAGVVIYRPSSINAIGNPCLEVGDPIKVSTKYQSIETYILSRTLKGIQGIKDTYLAKGSEYSGNNVNSVQRSIIQLKGKTNELVRTVEETKSTITNVEKGLQTQITQNAEGIKAEATRAENAEEQLRSSISVSAEQIRSEVSATYSTKKETSTAVNNAIDTASKDATNKANVAESNANSATDNKLKSYSTTTQMNSAINQKADSILVSVNEDITETRTYIDGQVNTLNTNLSASIKLNSDAITSEVSRAQNAETQLSTRLTQTESGFNAQIESIDGRVTEINAGLDSVSSEISGYNGRFSKIEQTIEGVTFQDENGVTKISGDTITTGTIKGVALLFMLQERIFWACGTSDLSIAAEFGEWVCDSNALYANDANGNRVIELYRRTTGGGMYSKGNAILIGDVYCNDVIVTGTQNISLINAYDLADSAKGLANTNAESIAGVNESISDINANISEMKEDISGNSTKISELFGHVGTLIETIPGLDSRITSNASEIADIRSGSAGSSTLASQISSLLERVGTLEDIVFA